MSTTASPRELSLSGRRIPLLSTPTTSSRPSIDTARSESSPSRPAVLSNTNTNTSTSPTPGAQPQRNRAALRQYYNLHKASGSGGPSSLSTTSQAPSSPATSSIYSRADEDGTRDGESAASELDRAGFDAEEYVRRVLEEKSLGEVLGIYRGVLADVRALDAERKALVYDNYSKLIVATEMIGRMREGVGDNPAAGGRRKGEGVEGVEELVERVRRGVEGLRSEGLGGIAGVGQGDGEKAEKRRKTRLVVERVLATPDRVRGLVQDGKVDEARSVWEKEKRLLERWRERGVGGPDVGECIENGERALKGEEAISRVDTKT